MMYFNKNFKNVAVKLSGGADSSLIYYYVCDYYKDNNIKANIYPITLVTDQKSFYKDSTIRVIDVVKQLTGISPKEHIFVYGNHNEYSDILDNGVNDAIKKYDIDIVYTGMSINAPVEEIKTWVKLNHSKYNLDINLAEYHIETRDKSRDTIPNHDVVGTMPPTHTVLYSSPYAHSDKRVIAADYKRFGLIETLFPYTISCASYTTETYTTLENHKHCGNNCLPCLERYWAFGGLI